MTTAIQRIEKVSPLITEVSDRVQNEMRSASNPPAFAWQLDQLAYVASGQASQYIFTIPTLPSLPRLMVPGAGLRTEQVSIGSVTVLAQTYATSITADKFDQMNPQIANATNWMINSLANIGMQHYRQELGRLLATNPTQTYQDGVAFFSASHPVNPFNSAQLNPALNSAVQSNLHSSRPFNLTNLLTTIADVNQLCWTNGTPFRPTGFDIILPPGCDWMKAIHWVKGASSGANLLANGTADVGSNSNVFQYSGQVYPTGINVIPFPEYAAGVSGTLATDWFVRPHAIKPFLIYERQPHKMVDLNSDNDFNMFLQMRRYAKVEANFGLGYTHWMSVHKCTA